MAMAARSEEASDAGDEHGPVSKAQPASKPYSEPVFIDMTEVDEGRGFGFFVNPPPRSTPHAPGTAAAPWWPRAPRRRACRHGRCSRVRARPSFGRGGAEPSRRATDPGAQAGVGARRCSDA